MKSQKGKQTEQGIRTGNLIRELRFQKGYSQAKLAEALEVTAPAVNQWEKGKTFPKPEYLLKLSQLLDVSIDELIAGKAHPQAKLDGAVADALLGFAKRADELAHSTWIFGGDEQNGGNDNTE